MKVVDLLLGAVAPQISYEIVPPKRGSSVSDIFEIVDGLVPFDPPFIDVTSHSAQVYYEEQPDGSWRRRIRRKRPGTLGLCAAIKGRYGVETVPHLLCEGFTREESEDALIELNYLGIHNVMALRGDEGGYRKPVTGSRTRNEYAVDLVRQISDMNKGVYQEEMIGATPTDFCIGVAGYPEKHVEAPNMAWDVQNLKKKVNAGADYVVSQMFFDNQVFLRYLRQTREAGIDVPIVPGLKILTRKRQLQSLPSTFHLSVPEELAAEVMEAEDRHVPEIGIRWALKQCEELLAADVPYLHFYVIQTPEYVQPVIERLRKLA